MSNVLVATYLERTALFLAMIIFFDRSNCIFLLRVFYFVVQILVEMAGCIFPAVFTIGKVVASVLDRKSTSMYCLKQDRIMDKNLETLVALL